MHPDTPFLLILVHEKNTSLLYMSKRTGIYYDDSNRGHSKSVYMRVTMHDGNCVYGHCTCSSSIGFTQHVGSFKYLNVRNETVYNLLHLPSCNGRSCVCTKTLLDQGFYKIHMEVHDTHLTSNMELDASNVNMTQFLHQYPWSLLCPYSVVVLEKELLDLVRSEEHVEEDRDSLSFNFLLDDIPLTLSELNWTYTDSSSDSDDFFGLSTEEIEKLESVEMNQSHVEQGMDCSVCLQRFELHEQVTRLSCNHFFHKVCISTWLEKHLTCPFCRLEVSKEETDSSDTDWDGIGLVVLTLDE
ncbi:hypothetical protein JTE90_015018 [Oedothorax gibbosus]|uniref:RING-type domain-containing protein n=1 Tax=Oedothorax gibbosus TaxID=931172 RepID=A0AAV6TWR0_9ARAC|nr:hypothetical protein JTE90_015018 [Oedothorax gibbosus]